MVDFNVDYWVALIISFLISIIIFIVEYSFFNIINRNKKFAYFFKKKNMFYLWYFFIAVLTSLITLLSNFSLFKDNNFFLIANAFVFSLIFHPIVGYISIALILIIEISLYFSHMINSFILYNSLLLLCLYGIYIFLSWIFVYKNNFLVFIYSILISIAMNFDILFASKISVLALIINNIALFLYTLLAYTLVKSFNQFILNVRNLNESIYMKNNFILNRYFNDYFSLFRKNNKLEYGCLFLIKFNFYNQIANEYSASLSNKIRIKMLNELHLLLANKSIFYFITKNNEYAFLSKIDYLTSIEKSIEGNNYLNRLNDDILQEYEKIIKKLPTNIKINNHNFASSIKINACFYGIQDNDIYRIIEKCENINNESKNIINLYTYQPNQDNFEIEQKKNNILLLNNFFKNNEIDINYENIKLNGKKYIYGTPILFSKLFFSWDDFVVYDEEINDAIVSHISALVIKKNQLNNSLLLFNYNKKTLSDPDFDINLLINKIVNMCNRQKFAINLIFDDDNINETLIKNMKIICNKKIELYLHYPWNNTDIIINNFKFSSIKINNDKKTFNLLPHYRIFNYLSL